MIVDNKSARVELLWKLGNIISQKVKSGESHIKVLDEVYSLLERKIPFDRLSIALCEGSYLALRWVQSENLVKYLNLGYKSPISGSSLEAMLKSKSPRIINDLLAYFLEHPESESTKKALSDGILSNLTFPLCSDGVVIGFLFFSSCRIGAYGSQHIELCSQIADELALLISYAKLHNFFEMHQSSEAFLRNTLHELRSPLHVIQGYLDLLKDEVWYSRLDEESKNIFAVLRRNSESMAQLISELEMIA